MGTVGYRELFHKREISMWLILFLCAISAQDLSQISERIYQNECSSKPENLVHWNQGEKCLSLGIGHFIWYPEGETEGFSERFPLFVEYLKSKNVELIPLLQKNLHCPWRDRDAFLAAKNSKQVEDLRSFLLKTRSYQAAFMAQRISSALTPMLQGVDPERKKHIEERFQRLYSDPKGLYALIDYVNFKGEGVSPQERYKGQGWGLLQLLEEMNDGSDLMTSFCDAAKLVLARRVANSLPEKNEARWLSGWNARIDTYKK